MKTIEIASGRGRTRPHSMRRGTRVHAVLLVCGILSSVLYVAMNIFVPMRWGAYSLASQTVSELSAIGAPTRPLWVPLGNLYTLLLMAFGWGVREVAGRNRNLRIAGTLMMAHAFVGLYWPPMHLRGVEPTLTDALHIVWALAAVLLMLLTIGFGAAALDRRFRIYSFATLAVFVVFGTLTGIDGPRIAADLPTPWIGVWERINIAAFMLWVAVLAVVLLRGAAERERVGVAAESGAG